MHFARLRKKYLSIYIKCLQSNPNLVTCHENKEIQEIECDVDVDVFFGERLYIDNCSLTFRLKIVIQRSE